MGILKITPRRESLQSGQSVGAGQVHIPSLPTSRDTGEIQKWRGVGDLGRGVADLGDKMLKIAVSLQEERNEMELNEFESDFLNSLRGVTMDPEKGLFTRNLVTSKDIDALANDGPKAVKDVFDEVAERHGFTGNKRTWAEHRVRGAVLSTQGRIVERVAGAHRQLKITTATNLTKAQLGHWRDNPADQNATLNLIDSYRAQQYASGYDDQAVDLKVGQFVGDIAAEYATQSFKTLPDEKAVDDMLGKLEKDPSAILAGNRVLAGQFSTKNPFDPKTTDQLKGALEARRREIQARDMRTVSEAANVGIAAVAQIRDKDGNYPAGRLATVESSIGSLQRIQAALPKGSNAATRAATHIAELDSKADMIATSEWLDQLMDGYCVTRDEKSGVAMVSKPIGIKNGSREDRAFDAAKEKYLKAVEDAGNDLEKARAKIWDGNKEILQRKLVSYYQAASEPGEVGTRRAQEAYHELMAAWSEMSGGSLSPDFTLGFQKTVQEIDQKEIADGMRLFWSMLKGVKVLSPKDYNSRQASSAVPKFDKYGGLTDATVRRMDLGAEVAYDTGNPDEPFVMTVDEALQFSETVRNELANLDPKELQKSGVVRDVIGRVYSNAAKKIIEKNIGKVQALSQTFGETIEELQTKMKEPAARSLVEAVEGKKETDEIRKRYEQK